MYYRAIEPCYEHKHLYIIRIKSHPTGNHWWLINCLRSGSKVPPASIYFKRSLGQGQAVGIVLINQYGFHTAIMTNFTNGVVSLMILSEEHTTILKHYSNSMEILFCVIRLWDIRSLWRDFYWDIHIQILMRISYFQRLWITDEKPLVTCHGPMVNNYYCRKSL